MNPESTKCNVLKARNLCKEAAGYSNDIPARLIQNVMTEYSQQTKGNMPSKNALSQFVKR